MTLCASSVTSSAATLNGVVDPQGKHAGADVAVLAARRLRTVAVATASQPDPHTANNFVTGSTRFVPRRPPRYTG